MPKLTHDQENSIRRAIRDVYAVDPLITDKKLIDALNARFNRSFDWTYINRLKKKVKIEMLPAVDREKSMKALMNIRETFRLAREDILPIAFGQKGLPSTAERLSAWRTIAMLEKMKLEMEFELGLYADQQSTNPDQFRFTPVPAEIRERMLETFRLWRMPAGLTRKIEPTRTIDAESREMPRSQPIAPVAGGEPPKLANNEPKPTPISHGIVADPELQLG